MKIKANQDIYYSTTADTLTYYIENKGNMIFKGKAYKNPDAANCNINVTKICRDWVKNTLPDFRNVANSAITQEEAYQEFKLYTYSATTVEGEEVLVPVLLETYNILFDYDYELPWNGGSKILSNPINGRMDSRMKLMYSVYKANTGETICYSLRALNPIININPRTISTSYSEKTVNISVSSNTEFDIVSNRDWLIPSSIVGVSGTSTVNISIGENEDIYNMRSGSVKFGNTDLNVYQQKHPVGNVLTYTTTDNTRLNINGLRDLGVFIESHNFSNYSGTVITRTDILGIQNSAFTKTTINTMRFPDTVTEIKSMAFSGCSGMTYINTGEQLITIGDNAFDGCNQLTGITLPNTVRTIGEYTFRLCYRLTGITIPNVTSIGYGAFKQCWRLINIQLPNTLTTLGGAAFYDCDSLTGITIPNNITIIEPQTFRHCTSLTGITIPNSVTRIRYEAFQDCSNLRRAIIPESVTVIDWDVFTRCSSLNNITYQGTIAQWASIEKGIDWNYGVPATVVHCTDGDVAI